MTPRAAYISGAAAIVAGLALLLTTPADVIAALLVIAAGSAHPVRDLHRRSSPRAAHRLQAAQPATRRTVSVYFERPAVPPAPGRPWHRCQAVARVVNGWCICRRRRWHIGYHSDKFIRDDREAE